MVELIIMNMQMLNIVKNILVEFNHIDLIDLGGDFAAVAVQVTDTQLDTILNICGETFEENLDYFIEDVIII